MYPAAFEYHAPASVKEALGLLGKLKDDAKLLAGGHSLIPMMKLRLAQPKHLIDLRKVPGLTGIKQDGNMLAIGAMTTHWEVESSALVKSKLAVLSEVAALIGDPAVRNRGTVGGSLAHADPAGDLSWSLRASIRVYADTSVVLRPEGPPSLSISAGKSTGSAFRLPAKMPWPLGDGFVPLGLLVATVDGRSWTREIPLAPVAAGPKR